MQPIRIIHTSDWHLGQYFMGQSRQAEHAKLIDWLAAEIVRHKVDVVLIAGDLFDSASPPSYARELYSRLILTVRDAGAQLVLLGGNHDSVSVLNESRDLLRALETTVVAAVAEDISEQLVTLRNSAGEAAATLCAIPYIRPHEVQRSRAGQSAEDKQRSLQQAIAEHYNELFKAAKEFNKNLPVIMTGHLTTIGATVSESVREIYVGSLQAFPASSFPPADYVALGHIHRPQRVGSSEHIRYSGSPIPLAFDEAGQQKQMNLLTFNSGAATIESLPVPCFRRLASIHGSLATLPDKLADFVATGIQETAQSMDSQPAGSIADLFGDVGESPSIAVPAETTTNSVDGDLTLTPWLEIVVEQDEYLSDLQSPIQAMLEGYDLEVLRIRRLRKAGAQALQQQSMETLDELDVAEVFERRLALEPLDEDDKNTLVGLHASLVESLKSADDDHGEPSGQSPNKPLAN